MLKGGLNHEMKNRYLLHIGFWVVYTAAYALLNMSFIEKMTMVEYSLGSRFIKFWVAELWLLPMKLMATYGFLYYLLPRFFKPGNYIGLLWRCLLGLIPLLILTRVLVYYQVFPLLYNESPSAELFSAPRFFFSFLEMASAVAIASTVKLLRGQIQSQRREERLLREKLQSELSFLRAQTNPHFLFNTLNNIYALARKQSTNTAPVVMKLSQIMRFMLYECTNPRIALNDEIQVIRDYIDLENLRYNSRLSVELNDRLDRPGQPIAPLLLLPFVENAFKHGASETRFNTFIKIDLQLEKGILNARIENNKEENQEPKTGGIGLKNVRRQLELIYPNRHRLEIKNEASLFTVLLYIDLNQDL